MKEEKQVKTEIENEIATELKTNEITEEEAQRAGRKPFVIHDFDAPHDREMAVFTCAKKLSEYIFVITEKSPKKFRWSIITRLQNASVDIIENLYRANFEREAENRIAYQKSALVSINLVDFFAETARSKGAINLHQTSVIAKQIVECKKLLNGWVKATKNK
ncbi:MAG: four helix bundle protein [Clostridiales bacterium]|nr:four helix bundle protein [Clostridiales bacterium]